jgi:hypothetical protein
MDNMRTVNNDIHSFVTGVEQINTKAVEIADSCNKQVAFYKERDRFVLAFRKYIKENNIKLTAALFKISGVDVDIYELFCQVRKHGGLAEVCKMCMWCEIWKELANSNELISYETETQLRDLYCDYMLPFEYYFKKAVD